MSSFSSSWQTNAPHIPATLHSYAEQFDWVNEHFEFMPYFFHTKKGVPNLIDSMISPDIVASNFVSWNLNRTHKFLKLTKKRFPEAITIAGGNNLPKLPQKDFFKQFPYIDIIVHGEGEKTFLDILEARVNCKAHEFKEKLTEVKGISINQNGEVFQTPPAPLLRNEDGILEIPSPFLTGKFEHYFDEIDKLGEFRGGVWETTRGCPYSCTFCDWGQLTNSKIRRFSDERVFSEIDYFVEHFDEIFFADANFGILDRDPIIAEKIADAYERISNRRLKTLHVGGAKNSNNRMLQIGKTLNRTPLTRSGMSLSLQTYTQPALDAVKRKNISKEKMISLQEEYFNNDIPSYCDLIINCPNETFESFKATLDFVLSQSFTDIRMFTMDLYPNSEIASQVELYGIKTEKYKIFNGVEPDEDEFIEKVVSTSTMTEKETRKLTLICRSLEILHLGKWTYFISTYLNRAFDIPFSLFYEKLLEYAWELPETPIGMAIKQGYLKKYNKGITSHFEGSYSPHGIKWKDSFFRKEVFSWLCISEAREEFYSQLEHFISTLLDDRKWNREILRFNKEMMYSPDYNPEKGKELSFQSNWHDFFNSKAPLEFRDNVLLISDTHVGRKHDSMKIQNENLDWLRWAAGGRSYFVQRQNSYTYQQIKCEYMDE